MKKSVACIVKKKVVTYWIAVMPDGKEVEIRGVAKNKLKNGMKLNGELMVEHVQHKDDDGSYARSYSIEEWLQVNRIQS